MSELKQFRLPDVGEGLTEAEILKWHVRPGDQVTVNQIIVEIETAKAVVELPSPYQGVVADLLVPEGATADAGTPIIEVQVGDGAPETAVSTAPDAISSPPATGAVEPGIHGSPAPKAERQAVLVGYGVKRGATKRRARKPTAARAIATSAGAAAAHRPAATEASATTAAPADGGRTAVLAKPPVRKLAKDLGVDL